MKQRLVHLRTVPFLLSGWLMAAMPSFAQVSPFNGLQAVPDSSGRVRVIIGGHFYGSGQVRSGYPASTVLANVDTLNALNAQLLLSTGDLFLNAKADSARYARAFFHQLHMPVFNAVGNHDLDGGHYTGRFGSTDAAFRVGPLLVVVLDTERNNGDLDGSQLDMLRSARESLAAGAVHTLFIVSHRPVWAEADERYSPLFLGNTRSLTGTNFRSQVWPLLQELAQAGEVYWISGSMGGRAPASIFFQPHAPRLTYIQCAVRDEPRDAVLIADVDADGVTWNALSLTGRVLPAPGTFDAAWWEARVGKREGPNWRLLPYLVKSTVTHRAFWWGMATALLVLALLRQWRRR